MKKFLLSAFCLFAVGYLFAQQTFTVNASGFSFNPATINAHVGDQVVFNAGASHPVLQVSEATYTSNGSTAFPGGFDFPAGSGSITLNEAGTLYYICTAHISFGMKGLIVVSEATAVSPHQTSQNFEIYPNPVKDQLFLNLHGNIAGSVNIYDVSGKVILKAGEDELKSNSINVESLRKGLYFITAELSDKTYTLKFIKQ